MPAAAAQAEEEHAYIVVLKDSVQDVGATAAGQWQKYSVASSHTYRYAFKGYSGTMTPSEAANLRTDAAVEFVAAARTFELPPTPVAVQPQAVPAWWQRVGGTTDDGAGNLPGAGGPLAGVNTAVIDSGIDSTHPDLNVRGGVDCSAGTAVPEVPIDVDGHGTGVAGIIGALDNNVGVIGTAPGTPLWSARVFAAGAIGTAEENVICGVDWVTSTRMDDDPTNDIEVANMSLGAPGTDTQHCGGGTDAYHLAVCRSVEAGVTYAVAAGNDGADFANTVPASYDEVLTATAISDFDGLPGGLGKPQCAGVTAPAFGFDDAAAPFSNFATQRWDRRHTVAAPGVCVLTTAPGGGVAEVHGTSQASPVIAGSVGLCIASGTCDGGSNQVMRQFLAATEEYNQNHPDYGFLGDPFRRIEGRHYGYLVNRALF